MEQIRSDATLIFNYLEVKRLMRLSMEDRCRHRRFDFFSLLKRFRSFDKIFLSDIIIDSSLSFAVSPR